MLDAGYWMLDTGCWMLDAGCWMLDDGCWMLDAGCWMLDDGCWMLDDGCWMGNILVSSIEYPASSIRKFSTGRVKLSLYKAYYYAPHHYICTVFGSRHNGIKREVRCNSGAIPVAVSSFRDSSNLSREINSRFMSHASRYACWIFKPLFR
jgi:hypothetical protein